MPEKITEVEFATNIIPAIAKAAIISIKMGTPFNFQASVMGIAKEAGLEDSISEVFQGPEFMENIQWLIRKGII